MIRGEAFLLEDGLLNIQEGGTRDIFKAVRCFFPFARIIEVERFLRGVLIGVPVLLYLLQRGLGPFLALGFCEFVRSHPLIGEIEVLLEFGLRVIELLAKLRQLGRVVGDEDHRRLEARGVQAVRHIADDSEIVRPGLDDARILFDLRAGIERVDAKEDEERNQQQIAAGRFFDNGHSLHAYITPIFIAGPLPERRVVSSAVSHTT